MMIVVGSRDGAVVRAFASHQCVLGLIPGCGNMWVEFVVGSLPCFKRFPSGYCGFPLSSKTNFSKFQFDLILDYCQALCHEPLVIAEALPVFDRAQNFDSLAIEHWRLNFQNWSPAGYSCFV